MFKYVTVKKLSEQCGYTEKAIRRKIEEGIFIQGIHYLKAPDGRIHFDLVQYEKWLKNESKIPA